MKDQPAFPADEPLQPAHDCQCDICRQQRQDTAAAAIVTLVETTSGEAGCPPEKSKESLKPRI
jgi:hypothetical protein